MSNIITKLYDSTNADELKATVGLVLAALGGVLQNRLGLSFGEDLATAAISVTSGFLIELFFVFVLSGIIRQKPLSSVSEKFRTLTGTLFAILATSIVISGGSELKAFVTGMTVLTAIAVGIIRFTEIDARSDAIFPLMNILLVLLYVFIISLQFLSEIGFCWIVGVSAVVSILVIIRHLRMRSVDN